MTTFKMIRIRNAELNDIPCLVNLWIEFMDFHAALDSAFVRSTDAAENWAAFITPKLAEDDFRILVAECEDSIVGYAIATVMEYPPIITLRKYGFITDIAVTAEYRRRGIAHQLYKNAEEWLLATGVPRIELKVDVVNNASRSFWEKEGFSRHTETLIKKL